MTKTILIVDDSATMRELLSFAVNEAGYGAITAVNGRDALNKLKNTEIEMVITDLIMPVMDGIEFIRQLRNSIANRLTPVVILTTESQQSRIQEGKAAGASEWIVKPFTPEELLEVIKKHIK